MGRFGACYVCLVVGLDACWVCLIVGFGDGCFSGWVSVMVVLVAGFRWWLDSVRGSDGGG